LTLWPNYILHQGLNALAPSSFWNCRNAKNRWCDLLFFVISFPENVCCWEIVALSSGRQVFTPPTRKPSANPGVGDWGCFYNLFGDLFVRCRSPVIGL